VNDYDKLFHLFVGLVGKERLTGRSPMNSRNCLMSQHVTTIDRWVLP